MGESNEEVSIADNDTEKVQEVLWSRRELLRAAIKGGGIRHAIMIGDVEAPQGITEQQLHQQLEDLMAHGHIELDDAHKLLLTAKGMLEFVQLNHPRIPTVLSEEVEG